MVRLFSSIDNKYTVYIRYIINCYGIKFAFDNKENYYDYYKDKNN